MIHWVKVVVKKTFYGFCGFYQITANKTYKLQLRQEYHTHKVIDDRPAAAQKFR